SGVRNTFYRIAAIVAQGELVVLAGEIHQRTGSFVTAWTLVFALMTGIFLLLALYHRWQLPRPTDDVPGGKLILQNFLGTFVTFFQKPKIGLLIAFLLLYRFGEAQLLNVAKFFLLDPREKGGLALTDDQFGWLYGHVGVGALLCGGLL